MLRCVRHFRRTQYFQITISRNIQTQLFLSHSSNTNKLESLSKFNWASYSKSPFSFRSFSSHSGENEVFEHSFDEELVQQVDAELVSGGGGGGGSWYDPAVDTMVSVLDGYHEVSGFPWWVIVATSTLALRLVLMPVLILQMRKMKRFAELLPNLPPPFPPPSSGKSYLEQYLEFREKKRAVQCPSALWSLAYFSVQFPCFLLWMITFRTMSLGHHPGFDHGGTLWFRNLTELSHGTLGLVLPTMVAGLHFISIQLSFQASSFENLSGFFRLWAKFYKLYLDILTLPIFAFGFYVPQGSLIYWVTNSSLTVIQLLSLNNSTVRDMLGLPAPTALPKEKKFIELGTVKVKDLSLQKEYEIQVQNLSPDELFSLSIQMLAERHQDKAIAILRLALDKNPEHLRALVVLGETLMQNEMLVPATEYLDRAISKICLVGYPTEDEEIGLLILASSWVGCIYLQQGKHQQGFEHLKRIAHFDEPRDPKFRLHYYKSLEFLSSALSKVGRENEAAQYMQKVAAYDPASEVRYESTSVESILSAHARKLR